jgi:hypothetical protein
MVVGLAFSPDLERVSDQRPDTVIPLHHRTVDEWTNLLDVRRAFLVQHTLVYLDIQDLTHVAFSESIFRVSLL